MSVEDLLDKQRPKDGTWKELARIASETDEMAAELMDLHAIFLARTGKNIDEWVSETMPEVFALIEAGIDHPDKSDSLTMKIAAWIGGLGHAVNEVRGIDILNIDRTDPIEGMYQRMYAGVNKESVNYIAEQRARRMNIFPSDNSLEFMTTLFAAYIDGFTTGYVYQKERTL